MIEVDESTGIGACLDMEVDEVGENSGNIQKRDFSDIDRIWPSMPFGPFVQSQLIWRVFGTYQAVPP
jgi:hypothetical protein